MTDYEEMEREERRKRGERHGLGEQEVLAADRLGMDLRRYAAFRGARNVEQMREAEAQLAAQDKARDDATHEIEVERQKAELRR